MQLERDGMKTYSLRATGNAGVKDLFLSGEYAKQDKPHTATEDAWYLEAGWTFSDGTLDAVCQLSLQPFLGRLRHAVLRRSAAASAPGSRVKWRATMPGRSTPTRASSNSSSPSRPWKT